MPDASLPTSSDLVTDLIWMFEDGEFFSLLVGGLVLLMVSRRVIDGRLGVQQWGYRVGILAFVCWYLRDIENNGIWGAEQFVSTGFRGLLVLLYSVAASWLFLAIASCVWTELLTDLTRLTGSRWNRAATTVRKLLDERRKRSIVFEESDDQREKRRLDEQLGAERAQQLAAERAQKASQQAEIQKRETRERADLRYGVELLYDRYRAELNDKLPPERFHTYFSDHLTNDLPVEVYAHRAEQLKNMIRDRLEVRQKNVLPDFNSIEDIIEHFRIRKQKLQFLNLDPDTLETMEIAIDDAQDRELRKFLS